MRIAVVTVKKSLVNLGSPKEFDACDTSGSPQIYFSSLYNIIEEKTSRAGGMASRRAHNPF